MSKTRLVFLVVFSVVFLVLVSMMVFHRLKPMPKGTDVWGSEHVMPAEDVRFFSDITYANDDGTRVWEQDIFPAIFEMIKAARRFIVIDMFLFNSDGPTSGAYIPLSANLSNALIEKKEHFPEMRIVVITDEINNFYGSYTNPLLAELERNGIDVIITRLSRLRDSNMVYSSVWRSFIQWFGSEGKGWIPHPLGNKERKVTLRAFFRLLNTKANHRKIVISDDGKDVVSLVTSANPHDASSLHSNIAFQFRGGVWKDIMRSEQEIASFSRAPFSVPTGNPKGSSGGDASVRFVSEEAIRRALLKDIDELQRGEKLDMAMFYLSDRKVVSALVRAAQRGCKLRLILDPNKDAFSREKNGIPNRQVAHELMKKTEKAIAIRWYDTHGEQFHTKMTIVRKDDGQVIIHAGSANLTRRNIGNFNLEGNVVVRLPGSAESARAVQAYFDRIWNNKGMEFTLDYEDFEETGWFKYIVYWIQETTGFSTF